MFPEAYKRVLGASGVKQPLIGVVIGRLAIAAEPLSTVLLVHGATGTFAAAGAVMGAYSIAAAVGLPIQGRLMDRVGQTRVIPVTTVLTAMGFITLILFAHGGASTAVLCAVAALAGLGTIPTGTAMRTLWSDLVPETELRQAAFAIDAVAIDVAFIAGPLIAAAVIALASPTASLGVCIALSVLGSADIRLVARVPRLARGAHRAPANWATARQGRLGVDGRRARYRDRGGGRRARRRPPSHRRKGQRSWAAR